MCLLHILSVAVLAFPVAALTIPSTLLELHIPDGRASLRNRHFNNNLDLSCNAAIAPNLTSRILQSPIVPERRKGLPKTTRKSKESALGFIAGIAGLKTAIFRNFAFDFYPSTMSSCCFIYPNALRFQNCNHEKLDKGTIWGRKLIPSEVCFSKSAKRATSLP